MSHVWPKLIARAAAVICVLVFAPAAMADATYTWNGRASSTNWSNPSNWSAAPSNDASGTFNFQAVGGCPGGDACYQSNNDLTGIAATGLTLDGAAPYVISGNAISLGSGGITVSVDPGAYLGPTFPQIELPMTLASDQTWSLSASQGENGGLNVTGDLSGDALTVNLANASRLILGGADQIGAFQASGNGGIVVNHSLNGGTSNPVTVTGPALTLASGSSSLVQTGPLTLAGDQLAIGQSGSAAGGAAVTGPVSIGSGGYTGMYIDGAGSTGGRDYSQLTATGNISVGGPLGLQAGYGGTCQTFRPGTVDTLIQTTGALSGRFSNLADGDETDLATYCGGAEVGFRINYTPHSVIATVLGTSTTTLGANPNRAVTNQPVTLTATVTPQNSGTASGTIEFDSVHNPIAGCSAQPITRQSNGTYAATCTTSFDTSGGGDLAATFNPDANSPTSGSTNGAFPVDVPVDPDATTTSLTASNSAPKAGAPVTYTATVTQAHAGSVAPGGAVEFLDGTTPVSGCGGQTPEHATCTVTYTSGGPHSITAHYLGDANFNPSTSSPQSVTVSAVSSPNSGHAPEPGTGKASIGAVTTNGDTASVPVSCAKGGASCAVKLELTRTVMVKVGKAHHRRTVKKVLALGSAQMTVPAGQRKVVRITLNGAGRRMLAAAHRLQSKLTARRASGAVVAVKTVAFKAKIKPKKH